MNANTPYKALTSEKFFFYEMRITAQLLLEGKSDKEIIEKIADDNLFQYPTEKRIRYLANVCLKRLNALDNVELVSMIARGSSETAKQVCLYAMMNYYRLVYDFMTTVIGEKFKLKDFSYSKKDVNVFFTRLQEQNSDVASWSESTVNKSKQILTRMLVDNGYLDKVKSETLNPILIDEDLKNLIIEKKDNEALIAFNYFGGL